MTRYKIVRSYQSGIRRRIKTVPGLIEAQLHCNNPETSSSTCTGKIAKDRTRKLGQWFDGYEKA